MVTEVSLVCVIFGSTVLADDNKCPSSRTFFPRPCHRPRPRHLA